MMPKFSKIRKKKARRKRSSQPQDALIPQSSVQRLVQRPASTWTNDNIMTLQRTLGNQAVLQLSRDDQVQRDYEDAYGSYQLLDDFELNGQANDNQQPQNAENAPEPPEIAALEQINEQYDNKEVRQYDTKPLASNHYRTEYINSTYLTNTVFDGLNKRTKAIMKQLTKAAEIYGMEDAERRYDAKMAQSPELDTDVSFREYIDLSKRSKVEQRKFIYLRFMGWDASDVAKYLDDEGKLIRTKVTYEDESTREQFKVTGGSTLMQNGEPFDTGNMFSKFMGSGFAIYVMDADGTLYANQHRVGLFHHSSFLSGADIAAAGEIKVTGGKVEYVTNKSGHYEPKRKHLVQVLNELQARGVNLGDVDVTELRQGFASKQRFPGGAKKYLELYG